MTDFNALAQLLFPQIDKMPADYEALYPPRGLPEGARVTRLAPSPTGFLHFGNLFAGLAAYKTAKATDGIFYVRVEDTDQKRKIEGAVEVMLEGLAAYGVTPDEGVMADGSEQGAYGPYVQSHRAEIYQCFAKQLVAQGQAYPCFCSAEELEEIRSAQENEDIKGYYGKYAKCRDLTLEEVKEKLAAGKPWTLRLRSPGDITKKCCFDDVIRGKIEMAENVIDVVLLKSDGIPTYHFAHVIDDHLMRTTHVTRGDEWIASVPLHLQLFRVLGFKPVKYAHIAPIMKEDNGGKRKLSKRKDPEAAVTFFSEAGYPPEALVDYMLTLANSNFEDWRRANPDAPQSAFPFNLKKMSVSGALFDLVKLNDVSKNMISRMTADAVYDRTLAWAAQYDTAYAEILRSNPEKALGMMALDRGGRKPRKDIAMWSEVKAYFSYMYTDLYEKNYTLPENISPADAAKILTDYIEVYSAADEKDVWFEKIKALCAPNGFTPNVKEYKANPDAFKGHVGDVSTVIRIAATGRTNTPDLCTILQLLGETEVRQRLSDAANYYMTLEA